MDPDTVYAGRNVHALAVAPSGNFLYSVTYDTALVWAFAIGADGKLSFSSTASLPVSASALGVAVAPSGKYLYVANSALPNQAISQFTIASDGSLTAMTPATVAAYEAANCVTVDPTGKYLYSTSQYSVSQFTIGSNGALTPMTPATVTSGTGSFNIVTIMK
jgi:6-phosphogluconolactonase (cycloisomerase 2 family)